MACRLPAAFSIRLASRVRRDLIEAETQQRLVEFLRRDLALGHSVPEISCIGASVEQGLLDFATGTRDRVCDLVPILRGKFSSSVDLHERQANLLVRLGRTTRYGIEVACRFRELVEALNVIRCELRRDALNIREIVDGLVRIALSCGSQLLDPIRINPRKLQGVRELLGSVGRGDSLRDETSDAHGCGHCCQRRDRALREASHRGEARARLARAPRSLLRCLSSLVEVARCRLDRPATASRLGAHRRKAPARALCGLLHAPCRGLHALRHFVDAVFRLSRGSIDRLTDALCNLCAAGADARAYAVREILTGVLPDVRDLRFGVGLNGLEKPLHGGHDVNVERASLVNARHVGVPLCSYSSSSSQFGRSAFIASSRKS